MELLEMFNNEMSLDVLHEFAGFKLREESWSRSEKMKVTCLDSVMWLVRLGALMSTVLKWLTESEIRGRCHQLYVDTYRRVAELAMSPLCRNVRVFVGYYGRGWAAGQAK